MSKDYKLDWYDELITANMVDIILKDLKKPTTNISIIKLFILISTNTKHEK